MLCVRWYLSFKLSSRDLVEIMSERRIALAHTTILRWVQRYVPEFEKLWNRYARSFGGSWRCDETYMKVKGRWIYLYRAVDKQGRTVDFLLSEKRDVGAAKRFFSKAMKNNGAPRVITLDAYAASHRAVAEMKSARTMPRRVGVRSNKYLNNVIEQDHRRIKHRIGPMLGFKRFDTAAMALVQTLRDLGWCCDNGRNGRANASIGIVQGSAIRPRGHRSVRALVSEFQAQFA